MNLKTETITKNSPSLPAIRSLYESAFPPNEKAPLAILLHKARKDFVDFLAFYDGDVQAGFAYLVAERDLVFLMYLAVEPSLRSKGYGSRILRELRQLYPGSRIVLNIEAQEPGASNAAERRRRKAFYVRNGYSGSGLLVKEFGVLYEALVQGGSVGREEFLRLYDRFMGFPFSLLTRPKIYPYTDQ
ncbi:GNAT family N-acetyltransferase [Saccharibacillus sp. CPCC 101409]|uniref:GNAT family N-acetyltransferase n=1 Tax=Saccharibacillus sp. CPCC 101409 TaxID=3058041 RepID=UPI0026725475|nr:GNAT family N-acetyltransferase [Saccharibacillus sp. CPCC 101409]MDO3412529.1 GNAT family N-acetyltransferase [Saccharibacillus sp. CPCC 101409]